MIKIFVSSTFSDMQSERDMIRKKVLPRLRHFSRKMGQDVSIVDLRWGISGEEMESDKVMSKILSVCAEEIDSCQPYFVLLLGDRYGTLPDEASLITFLKKHPEISSETLRHKSITEIEAILAIQKRLDTLKPIVCIRNSELLDKIPQQYVSIYSDTGEKAELLSAFKKSIQNNSIANVISYNVDWDTEKLEVCGLEAFADRLTESLIQQIANNIGESETSLEKEAMTFDNTVINNYLKRYVPRNEYISDIISFVNGEKTVLVLNGASGSGKTYIMSKATDIFSKTNGYKTVSLFLGYGFYDSSLENILTNLIYRLNNMVEKPVSVEKEASLKDLKLIATGLIKDICKTQKLVILVDNLSALQFEDMEQFFAAFPLPKNNSSYKLLVSTNNDSPVVTNALAGYAWHTMEILGIDEEKMQQMVSNLLAEEGKELGKKALTAFYNSSLFRSPLYISLALKRLMMLSGADFKNIYELSLRENVDGGEALSKYLIHLIENLPETEEKLADLIIDQLAEEIGIENHYLIIGLILTANEQLRAHDLVEIINTLSEKKVTLLDLINFVRNAEEIFTMSNLNGRMQFSHSLFKKYFEKKLLANEGKLQKAIFNYIDGLENDDPVRLRLYLSFALYTDNYSKALSFLRYANNYNTKEAYKELRPIFLSNDKKDEFIEMLNKLAEFAASKGSEELNIIASVYSNDIYYIINKASYGRNNAELQMLEPLYCLMLNHKCNITQESEYNRTIYMVAEKCGNATTDFESKCKYYGDFLKYCFEFYNNLNHSYKHIDYILSDLGFAYEKNATLAVEMHRWRDASKLYDLAIQTVSKDVPPNTNKLDLLEYQRSSHITDRYKLLMTDFCSKKRMGWNNQENLSTYCNNIFPELMQVIDFCEKAIDNFVQSDRCMVLASYYNLLMDANIVLSKYYNITDEPINEKFYLKKALNAGYVHYHLSDNVVSYDRIRFIELQLGVSEACDLDERLCYLKKANQKTLEIIQRISEQDMIENMKTVLDEINGQIMRIVFMKIHPKINIDSQEFSSNAYLVLKRDRTKIKEQNFNAIVSLCKDYLIETEQSERPKIFSYNSEYEKVVSGIFAGMLMTIQETIAFGAQKIYDDFVNAYGYIDKNPAEANMLFKKIWESNQDFIELISLFVSKHIDKLPGNYLPLAALQTVNIAEKAVHNLKVFAYESSQKDEAIFWEENEIELHAETVLYRTLKEMLLGEGFSIEQEEISLIHRCCPSVTDMCIFAFCIHKGGKFLEEYLNFHKGKERKHWYNIYQELVIANYPKVNKNIEIIGKFLCENIDTLAIKRIMYHSAFYESVALEYAYKNHRKDLAEKIIYNGYDHYLELETLYILRRYDRSFYYRIIGDLKLICLNKCIKESSRNYYAGYRYIRNTYGDIFCDELHKLAKNALENIKLAEKTDPRLRDKKKAPIWAQ